MPKRQCEGAGVCTVTSCAAPVPHGDVQELLRCRWRSGGACGADGCGAPAWPRLCVTAWRVELRSVVSVRAAATLRSPVPLRWASHSRAAVNAPRIGLRRTPQRPRSLLQARARGSMRQGAHLGCKSPRASVRYGERRSPPGGRIPEPTLGLWAQPLSTRSWCAACAGAPCSALAEPVCTLHRRLDGARPSRGCRKCVSCIAVRCASTVMGLRAKRRRVQRAAGSAAGCRRHLDCQFPAHVPSAAHTVTALQRARHPRQRSQHSGCAQLRAARGVLHQRGATACQTAPHAGSVSGSFAAHIRTRCAAPTSPRPSVAHQRRAARFRSV
jgi:hypothetical protein